MEGTTLTRPRPGPTPARPEPSVWDRGDRLAKVAFALLCLAFLIGFFVFPTYPVYDSYYSLLWGRDLLHGDPLVFDGFRYPTEHPLAIAAGAILQFFGGWADRLWVAVTLGSFLVLIAGVYRLGRMAATPLVGAVAAALLLTRFDYPFLAARGYIDIPYMAFVVWAATRSAGRSRPLPARARGDAAAGGVVPGRDVLGVGGLARDMAAASSLHRAGRARSADVGHGRLPGHRRPDVLADVHGRFRRGPRPSALALGAAAAIRCSSRTSVKLPVLVAAGVGLVFGVVISPRRMTMPLVLLLAGVVTFVAICVAGTSVIERYLAVPAVALMVFAAVAVAGWTMLLPSRLRTAWMVGAALIVVGGVVFTATRLNLGRFDDELRFRGQAHADLSAVLDDPRVKAGLRCGPLTGPNHKIVPDARWIAGLGDGKVRARAESYRDDRDVPIQDEGLAIVVTSRFAIFKHAWTDASDDARVQLAPPGFERVKTTRFYAAYVRC